MLNYGDIFKDDEGVMYRYTGPDGGEPDYNNPNTFIEASEWGKDNKVEHSSLDEKT